MCETRAADTTPGGTEAKPPTCGCPYEWKPFGRLYGVSMGNGWVRTGTSPDCIEHREAGEARRVG